MLAFAYLSAVAGITAAMGVVILFRRISLFTQGASATGGFVRWQAHGLRRIYYYPVIRFTASDGKEHEFVGGPGSTKKKAQSQYRVLYLPHEPGRAMVLSFFGFWAAPLVFLILSGASAFAAFQHLSQP